MKIDLWQRATIENMAAGFICSGAGPEQVSAADVDKLHSKIGQLVVERDFWQMPRTSCSGREAKMVSKDHKLNVHSQFALLTLARSNLYYEPEGESVENLRFMEIINKQFLETP